MRRVRVDLGPRSYDVVIGTGVAVRAEEWLPGDPRPAWIVTHPGLAGSAQRIAGAIEGAGWTAEVLEVPEGEPSKSFDCAAGLCADLASRRARRTDL